MVFLAKHMAVTSDHHGKKMPLAGACCIFETPSSEAKKSLHCRLGRDIMFLFLLGLYTKPPGNTSFKWVKFQHTSQLKKPKKKSSIWVVGSQIVWEEKYFNNECTFRRQVDLTFWPFSGIFFPDEKKECTFDDGKIETVSKPKLFL